MVVTSGALQMFFSANEGFQMAYVRILFCRLQIFRSSYFRFLSISIQFSFFQLHMEERWNRISMPVNTRPPKL